jgi:protein-S-isoprenylcysteine O-methyltransferase Ste14
MFILIRALTYATFFIGFVLVALPAWLAGPAGLERPAAMGWPQVLGAIMLIVGGAVTVSCVVTFVAVGRGTPAPFDPPRRLVDRGPYAIVRNPMYIGAILALLGAAAFYQSPAIAGYAATFFVVMHLFVIAYEEPTLRHTFGPAYDDYCGRVRRWI